MLFQKTTLKFESFQKGWIPNTEVFPNGNPNDSATDIVNFDIDSVKGGLVKTNGYVKDDIEYNSSLNEILGSNYKLKYIYNYSLGIPIPADLLLGIAYGSGVNPKYKWLIRDNIVDDNLLSSGDNKKWYDLLLTFTAKIYNHSTSVNFTTVFLSDFSNSEMLDADNNLISGFLNGFIVNYGTAYAVVVDCDEPNKIVITPAITTLQNGATMYFYRNRLLLDPDYSSIFNPSKEYSAIVVNNTASKLMIGLGKEIKPLWIGYIKRHYFYNKTTSTYLMDYNGKTPQNSIIIEKRIPECNFKVALTPYKMNGDIESGREIEIGITATFDGYQEVVANSISGLSLDKHILLNLYISHIGFQIFNYDLANASPVDGILQSDLYIKLYEGKQEKLEIRFINETDWDAFVSQIDLNTNPNKIWIRTRFNWTSIPSQEDLNEFATNLYNALSQNRYAEEHYYVGSFDWKEFAILDFILGNETSNPVIVLGSTDPAEFESDSEWKIVTNKRKFPAPIFSTNAKKITEGTNFVDTIEFLNGLVSGEVTNNFFETSLNYGYNTLGVVIKQDMALLNRRITAINIWGRYKPKDDTVSKWLYPYYLLKKIYISEENKHDKENTNGWTLSNREAIYISYIKHIYGNELDKVKSDTILSQDQLIELAGLKDIPQLLATLMYEPDVKIDVKYGAGTIFNNTSWVADTDDDVEVLRFSRMSSTGTNCLDIFSYDFNSSIGFETVGHDSPGHITALATKDDELVVLRDNSFFSIKTDVNAIDIRQCGNYIGCKYPKSVVSCRYGVIFADDNGIWLYQGLANTGANVIQINWQWENFYKALSNKSKMFACWNGKKEEYWLYIPDKNLGNYIYIADFKNIQSIDQSMELMKDKEKILVPWRKKKFNITSINSMTVDSYGNVIFNDDNYVYFDNYNVYSMDNQQYNEMRIESKIITQHSPMLKIYEVLTETLETTDDDWKFNIEFYVNDKSTPRKTVKMIGNSKNNKKLIFVRPVDLGNAINDISIRVNMGGMNGTTVKKLRAFGVNIMARKEKYVTE